MIDREKVRQELDRIRVNLQADGGDAELVEITDDGLVRLKLVGACRGCPMSQMTLKAGIERRLRQTVSEQIVVEGV